MRKTQRIAIIGGVIAALVVAGGIAYAFWTSTGSGNGSATTGTSTAWQVTVDNVNLADLTPNGPSDTVGFTVKNTNTGVQSLASTTASVTGTSNAGCTASDFNVSATTIAYGSVAAGATVPGSFTVQLKDTGLNQDACKGVTVNLKVDAS
jgi:hypothetical protein